MYNYQYEITDSGMVNIKGLPFKTRYVEVPNSKYSRKLNSYVLIKIDLENALKYLDKAVETDDLTIRIGLFRIAVILYTKCFLPAKNGGRSNIDKHKVYKNVPEDPIGCHEKFLKMRHKYLAHDEEDFLDAQFGMILDMDSEKAIAVAYIEKQAKFDYDESIDILQKLCQISLNWTKEELKRERKNVEENLKRQKFEELNAYPDMRIKLGTL